MASEWCCLETEWKRIIPLHRCTGLSVYNCLYSNPLSQPCSLAMLCSFWGAVLLAPLLHGEGPWSLQLPFHTIAASATTTSSHCVYHLLGLHQTPFCLGLCFCRCSLPPLQEYYKHFKANTAIQKCLTDVSLWQSLKHLIHAVLIILTLSEKKGFLPTFYENWHLEALIYFP